jgi:hypothetical protein
MVNLGSEEAITLARFKEFIWIWSTAIWRGGSICNKVYISVPLCPLPYPKSKSYRINQITPKEMCIKEAAASSEKTEFSKIRGQNYLDGCKKYKAVIWRFDHTFSAFTNKLRGSHEQTNHGRQILYIYTWTFSKRHEAITDNACEKPRESSCIYLSPIEVWSLCFSQALSVIASCLLEKVHVYIYIYSRVCQLSCKSYKLRLICIPFSCRKIKKNSRVGEICLRIPQKDNICLC